ncbi:hypothetical protein TL16_g01160 [Triparma laevis f. inornata]|uniref:Uncharacterized protein n=1 Tax=Triparma laevis f. inornata TaxID=1714386 RepID=A0A9W6ZHB6_9STRA|nr:hypothetical protein TL16_g01160 [Triparma laevis f. inornata]
MSNTIFSSREFHNFAASPPMMPSAAIPKRLVRKKSSKKASSKATSSSTSTTYTSSTWPKLKPKKKKKPTTKPQPHHTTSNSNSSSLPFNALDLHERDWDSSPPDLPADTSLFSTGLTPSELLNSTTPPKTLKKKKKKKAPPPDPFSAFLSNNPPPPPQPSLPKYKYSDGYLKHITFHEARKEAEKPMREAKEKVKKLSVQVTDLCTRFERFRIETSVSNIFKTYNLLVLRTIVKERFNHWAANCQLDYVSRQGKIQMVPKVILSWINRLTSQGFKKWAKITRIQKVMELRSKTTNIILKMILRGLAKKLLLRAFNRMRAGAVGGGNQQQDNGDEGYRRGGYGDLAWTEVPPGDFIN